MAVLRSVFHRGRPHAAILGGDLFVRVFASLPNDGGRRSRKMTGLVLGTRSLVRMELYRARVEKGSRLLLTFTMGESALTSSSKQNVSATLGV